VGWESGAKAAGRGKEGGDMRGKMKKRDEVSTLAILGPESAAPSDGSTHLVPVLDSYFDYLWVTK
jgi:hypothetical protein